MIKSYTYLITKAVVLILFFSSGVFAQSVITVASNGQVIDCDEEIYAKMESANIVNTITEADFPYLKNLDCITSGYVSEKRDLDLKLRNMDHWNNSHYVLTSAGSAIDVEATYDLEGNLIEATLIEKNTQIPIPILRYIYSGDEFDGWVMATNEKIVKDFDPYQTEYKVTLSNGDETEVLHFREQGEMIGFLDQR